MSITVVVVFERGAPFRRGAGVRGERRSAVPEFVDTPRRYNADEGPGKLDGRETGEDNRGRETLDVPQEFKPHGRENTPPKKFCRNGVAGRSSHRGLP